MRHREHPKRLTRGVHLVAGLALVLGPLFAAPPARSQDQPPQQATDKSRASNIPDEKINATAVAVVQVANLRRDYQQKIAAAPASEKAHMVSEANNAVVKAITDQGISLADYATIVEAAQSNSAIREKLIAHMPDPGQ